MPMANAKTVNYFSLLCLAVANLAAQSNSPWADSEVLAVTQPYSVDAALMAKGVVPDSLAVRYAGFPSRLGTWLPSDDYFWWNWDNSKRAEAQDAYLNIAVEANKNKPTWTGNLSSLNWGTANREFREAVYRYINFNRRLYLGGYVRYVYERSGFLDMVQAAAMVGALNYPRLSHKIDDSFLGYSDLSRQGCANSSLGSTNVPSVFSWDWYFSDWGNAVPGHRLWLLNQYATSVAVGICAPYSGSFSDATWLDYPSAFAAKVNERDPIKQAFCYPYPGYVPCTMLEPVSYDRGILRCSLSFESANASIDTSCRPTIKVTKDGRSLPVLNQGWCGDADLWYTVEVGSSFSPESFGADQQYEVTFDGIYFEGWTTPWGPSDDYWIPPEALTPRSFRYSFTVYNPYRVIPDGWSSRSSIQGLSTRARVGRGDEVLIGGLYISGTEPIRVMLRAQGPSLAAGGITDYAQNPKFEVHQVGSQAVPLGVVDNWNDEKSWRMVDSYGFAPSDVKDAATIATLAPGLYTISVTDQGSGGVGIVEAYAVDAMSSSQLSGVSTRGIMASGVDAMVAGIITQKQQTVVVSAKGPSLTEVGVAGAVKDTALRVVGSDGQTIAVNDDWDVAGNGRLKADLSAFAPLHPKEAALVLNLPPGAYTVVCESKSGKGVGIVEVYKIE